MARRRGTGGVCFAPDTNAPSRGGCTFILNHRALSETPNTILALHGREARRSDMVWAIVNRYYRRMLIKPSSIQIVADKCLMM